MKLTIEIPDAHTGDVLTFVAALLAKSTAVEAPADPAPGHPELPLMAGDIDEEGDIRWGVVGDLKDTPEAAPPLKNPSGPIMGIDAADPIRVAAEDPVEDTRPRLIPEVGRHYRSRHGQVLSCIRADGMTGDLECRSEHGPFYYQADGKPRAAAVCSPHWDLVEELTF